MNDNVPALDGQPQKHERYLPPKKMLKYFCCFQFLFYYFYSSMISSIYWNRMQLPCPMNDINFNNKYDMIIFAVSELLDRFEKEDKLFAAQCIWWLASIIQFTEIFTYYWQYNMFPSDYIKNDVVTPLLEWSVEGSFVPQFQILVLDIAMEIVEHPLDLDMVIHPSRKQLLPNYRNNKQDSKKLTINMTWSGNIFRIKHLMKMELEPTIGEQSQRQR